MAASEATVDISILVPVFNEEDGLDRCHSGIVTALEASSYSFEIVFVDDGSTDRSLACLHRLAAADPRVTVIRLAYNVGQQRAMYAALGHCGGQVVITYDADLQFHPECLTRLAHKVREGYDVVGGIRTQRRDPLFANRLPSWIGRKLINSALRMNQVDFGGVKAYSARIVKVLLTMGTPLIVIPAMAYSVSRRVTEIPVRHEPRVSGTSKWSVLCRMEAYLDLYTMYARRPFSWMLLCGAGCLAGALILALGIVAYRFLVSENFSGLIIFFDIFLFVTGLNLFALSLIGEFVVRGLRGRMFDRMQIVEDIVAAPDRSSGTLERRTRFSQPA